MESELWRRVYQVAVDAGKGRRVKRVQHSDVVVVLTYLWAVLHDRPVSWACRRQNWPLACRGAARPSPATMSRRLRRPSVKALLRQIEQRLRVRFGYSWCKWIDAKPLPVGESSHDADAHRGYADGRLKRGYKLYVICDGHGAPDAWKVLPMNLSEAQVARHLVRQVRAEAYLVGDSQYNASRLYDLAARQGLHLVAPRQREGDLGHHYQSPHRLWAIDVLRRPFGQTLMRQRYAIDRYFGTLTSFGGGLAPLPNWVRTLPRVHLWVQGKIILNMVRSLIRDSDAA
jgi:hypothetical protein